MSVAGWVALGLACLVAGGALALALVTSQRLRDVRGELGAARDELGKVLALTNAELQRFYDSEDLQEREYFILQMSRRGKTIKQITAALKALEIPNGSERTVKRCRSQLRKQGLLSVPEGDTS